MGIPPRDLDQCTLWEFMAMIKGWNKANGEPEKPAPPSFNEHRERVSRLVH
jgi:hypothetical protein